uniref:Uncharacterized protein n=1 Tax=Knipowitschia caucasica TaxID=637954 RepID=A0AAV2K2X2_KNICA
MATISDEPIQEGIGAGSRREVKTGARASHAVDKTEPPEDKNRREGDSCVRRAMAVFPWCEDRGEMSCGPCCLCLERRAAMTYAYVRAASNSPSAALMWAGSSWIPREPGL